LIRLHRVGGRPPVDDELVEIADDGSVSVRRTISRAAAPPGPVGRFTDHLDGEAARRIRDEAKIAAAAGNVDLPVPAGAARDDVQVPGGRAVVPAGAALPVGWTDLAASLRALLTAVQDHPAAALEATLDKSEILELRHLGSDPVDLDLSGLVVRISTWRDDRLINAVESLAAGPRAIVAGRGWRQSIEVQLATPPPGVRRMIELEGVLIGDGQAWRVCSLEARST
jgi:hypothetical protein